MIEIDKIISIQPDCVNKVVFKTKHNSFSLAVDDVKYLMSQIQRDEAKRRAVSKIDESPLALAYSKRKGTLL